MPFRCRQKLSVAQAGRIFFEVGTPNPDTGFFEFSEVPQQLKLPDVSMTDLAACLKAGVPLEQVKCKLITPDTHGLARRLNDIKELGNNNSNGENNDEV